VRERPAAYDGCACRVAFAVCTDATSPAEAFYDALEEVDRAKMLRLFKQIGDQGRIFNREKFKKIAGTDELFEFKSHQIRMPCYFVPGNLLVITHGLIKKGDRLPPSDVSRAERIRREDIAREAAREKWPRRIQNSTNS
jgi:Phage derived protein Gp49-like (DUF891)